MSIKHLFGYVPNQSSFFQLTDSQPYGRNKSYTSYIGLNSKRKSDPNQKISKTTEVFSSSPIKLINNLDNDKTNRFLFPKSNFSGKSSFIPISFDDSSFDYLSKKFMDNTFHQNSEIINKKSKERLSNESKNQKVQHNHVLFIIYCIK